MRMITYKSNWSQPCFKMKQVNEQLIKFKGKKMCNPFQLQINKCKVIWKVATFWSDTVMRQYKSNAQKPVWRHREDIFPPLLLPLIFVFFQKSLHLSYQAEWPKSSPWHISTIPSFGTSRYKWDAPLWSLWQLVAKLLIGNILFLNNTTILPSVSFFLLLKRNFQKTLKWQKTELGK